MVPKVLPDGSMSNTADKMRPITVLPALHRVASRILNSRILRILLQNPGILHWSQRAFTRNGSTDQCIDMTQDAIEETLEDHRPLARCDYDQRKAYDSVQAYSIKAALRRLSFPESFIDYVMSSLENARSRVRTWHGFTSIRIMFSGLRQGDPLSPILYNIVIDVLSVRLDERGQGYQFAHCEIVLTNCKYADDISAMSGDATLRAQEGPLRGIHVTHQVIREFCGAQCWDLNTAKSFFTTKWDPNLILPLMPVAGRGEPSIAPQTGKAEGRYLGVYQSLEGVWRRQHRVQTSKLDRWTKEVRAHDHSITQAVDAFNTMVLPRLEVALGTATTSTRMIQAWDATARRTVRRITGPSMVRHLANPPIQLALGLTSIADRRVIRAGTRAAQRLDYDSLPDGQTAWGRVRAATGTADIPSAAESLLQSWGRRTSNGGTTAS